MSIENTITMLSEVFSASRLPRLETEILAAHSLGISREQLLQFDTHKPLSVSNRKKIRNLETKRLSGWPIAYLTGSQAFYTVDLYVSPAVLIPRPETEMIVDLVLENIGNGIRLLDIGTGSGAIPIAIASETRRSFPAAYRRSDIIAVDISPSALRVARRNAKRYRLDKKIRFVKSNLLSNNKYSLTGHLPLVITANLPYLTPSQIKASPTIAREPRLALDGGKDGLKYYRRLFAQLKKSLTDTDTTIICEIDPTQAKTITSLARQHFPECACEIVKDLSGRRRFTKIKIPR